MPTERFMREVKPVVGYCPKAQNVEQAYAVTRSIMGTGVPSMFDSLGRSTSRPDADDVIAKRRGVAARRLEPYKQYWHCCKRSLPANAVFLLAADTWGCRMPTMSAMLRSVGAEQTFGPADPGVRRVSIRPRAARLVPFRTLNLRTLGQWFTRPSHAACFSGGHAVALACPPYGSRTRQGRSPKQPRAGL